MFGRFQTPTLLRCPYASTTSRPNTFAAPGPLFRRGYCRRTCPHPSYLPETSGQLPQSEGPVSVEYQSVPVVLSALSRVARGGSREPSRLLDNRLDFATDFESGRFQGLRGVRLPGRTMTNEGVSMDVRKGAERMQTGWSSEYIPALSRIPLKSRDERLSMW